MCLCSDWPSPPNHPPLSLPLSLPSPPPSSLSLSPRPSEAASDGNPSYGAGEEVTGRRAEVQALADTGLNRMPLKLIHPLVCGMVCYFCTDVPGSHAHYFLGYFHTHAPLNTHSFTRMHAFLLHCRVHNAVGDWFRVRVKTWPDLWFSLFILGYDCDTTSWHHDIQHMHFWGLNTYPQVC